MRWQNTEIPSYQQAGFLRLVEENHAFNFQLWHAEDRARRNDRGYEFVYHAKREIDAFNQQRNNLMEIMDSWIVHHLNPAKPGANCPTHSETPGMMIDRLSIMALKAYHMSLQVLREDVDEAHRQQCQEKLTTIQAQKKQLHQCLLDLSQEIRAQRRTFIIYHQFKMYNDPKLNPELYKA